MHPPPPIATLVDRYSFERVHIGCSGTDVFRLTAANAPPLFLKFDTLFTSSGLNGEVERLRWLQGRLPVPRVIAFANGDDGDYLLTEAIEGATGVDAGRDDPDAVVAALACSLRSLHAQPIDDCPFDEPLRVWIQRAGERMVSGQVDESDFDTERRGRSAEDLFRELKNFPPLKHGRAITHGDACLPNIIFGNNFAVVGFVDCGRAGIADPYQDLALASRSISSNLGERWVPKFFEAYGLTKVDRQKLRFYRLLDEFF